jgi:chloride channel protein, CIC family
MKIKSPGRLGLVGLSLIAILVGVITGFGAVLFRGLIGLVHNVAFLGVLAVDYDASVSTWPSPSGVFVILVPVVGRIVVTLLITKFAPEARGHGVPEVMDAIYYKEGVIRPVVAVIKSLASAVSIGTGAAVGREGPITQIGAAIGSTSTARSGRFSISSLIRFQNFRSAISAGPNFQFFFWLVDARRKTFSLFFL